MKIPVKKSFFPQNLRLFYPLLYFPLRKSGLYAIFFRSYAPYPNRVNASAIDLS